MKCALCGWDSENVELTVSEEDKQEFLRCLLGNRKFSKSYSLYDDVFTIVFEGLSVDELTALTNSEKDKTETEIEKLRFLAVAKTLNGEPITRNYIDNCSATFFAALCKCQRLFVTLLNSLQKEAFSAPFWKAVGLRLP